MGKELTSGIRKEGEVKKGRKGNSLIILSRSMVDRTGVRWGESSEEFKGEIGTQAIGIEIGAKDKEVRNGVKIRAVKDGHDEHDIARVRTGRAARKERCLHTREWG